MSLEHFFATCARGLEGCLAAELQELQAMDVSVGRGGVQFAGDRLLLYKANLWARTAIRILMPILEAEVTSTDDLYETVRRMDWSRLMTPDHTLAVDCNVRDSAITHSQYAARRVKDAICDQFIDRVGKRPSVDTENPMIGLNLHIHQNFAVLSLDSSGESLHKRGYRPIQTKAPINESLAAGILSLLGWKPQEPLLDPMCGSGTFAIEAAWNGLKRPPGLTRKRFGFQGWMDFDVREWTHLRDAARANMGKVNPQPIIACEARADALALARGNARAAGVGHLLTFVQRDIQDLKAPDCAPGLIVCNPPYGERLGSERELSGLYETMGRVFRERFAGWRLGIIASNPRLLQRLEIRGLKEHRLFNGKIPCVLREHQL